MSLFIWDIISKSYSFTLRICFVFNLNGRHNFWVTWAGKEAATRNTWPLARADDTNNQLEQLGPSLAPIIHLDGFRHAIPVNKTPWTPLGHSTTRMGCGGTGTMCFETLWVWATDQAKQFQIKGRTIADVTM